MGPKVAAVGAPGVVGTGLPPRYEVGQDGARNEERCMPDRGVQDIESRSYPDEVLASPKDGLNWCVTKELVKLVLWVAL